MNQVLIQELRFLAFLFWFVIAITAGILTVFLLYTLISGDIEFIKACGRFI